MIDTEAEVSILWSPDTKSWLIGKEPDAGKDWAQEKGLTEDEIVGWHHRLKDMSLSKLQEIVKNVEALCPVVQGVTKIRTWLKQEQQN